MNIVSTIATVFGSRGGAAASPRRSVVRTSALAGVVVAAGLVGALGAHSSATQAASNFGCGAYATTYSVTGIDGRPGLGVRCVMNDSQLASSFIWYGEGHWGDFQYRHMGFGAFLGNNSGYGIAYDIQGPAVDQSLTMTVVAQTAGLPPDVIDVEPWHERWTRVLQMNYTALPAATYCGTHFTQYDVNDAGSPLRSGGGIRCVMQRISSQGPDAMTVWYGTGSWGNDRYTNIGLWRSGRTTGEAVDLCFAPNTFCNSTGPNGLKFQKISPVFNGTYHVTGAWNEVWQG